MAAGWRSRWSTELSAAPVGDAAAAPTAVPDPDASPAANGRRTASAAGDAAGLVASQLVAAASTFGTGIVLARALGPTGKGFVDVALASATLLQMVTGLSLASGVFYHTASGGVDHRRVARLAVAFAALTGLAAALALPLLAGTRVGGWLLPTGGGRTAIWLVAAMVAASQAQQLLQGVAKGRGRFGAFGASEVVARGGTLVLVALLLLAQVGTPVTYALAFVAAFLASGGFLAATALSGRPAMTSVPIRGIVRYSLPLYVGNVVQFLNYRLDVFLIMSFIGLAAVGRYTVAVWLAQVIWLVPSALATLVMRATAARTDAVFDRVAQTNRLSLLLAAACAIAVAVAGTVGVAFVFGEEFRGSVTPLLLLLPGVVLFCPTIILSGYLNGIGKQVYTTWVACASLGVTAVLNVLLIPRLGIAGAALTSTASYALSSAITLVLVRRLPDAPSLAALLVPCRGDLEMVRDLVQSTLASRRRAGRTP